MAFDYTQEKFSDAVYNLAVGRGAIRERLVDACKEISLIDLDRDMPEGELRIAIEDLMEQVTRIKDGEKGFIPATIEAMSVDEAHEIAKLIVALNYQLRSMND